MTGMKALQKCDVAAILKLYAPDATLESPLVPISWNRKRYLPRDPPPPESLACILNPLSACGYEVISRSFTEQPLSVARLFPALS